MNDTQLDQTLDRCGCCEAAETAPAIRNAPALPALNYRIGVYDQFLRRMLDALGRTPALSGFTSRTTDDPTVALLDATACVADILTFYQERLANEGYLRTATERRSVLELARAIGYELKPGVAASVHLTFTIESAVGAPGVSTIPLGTQVQSVPPQGQLPQVFETSADFVAYAEWNELRPRLTRPADLAILGEGTSPPGSGRLLLLGPPGTFPAGTPGLRTGLNPATLHRLDPAISAAQVDGLEVSHLYFTEDAGVSKGELILLAGTQEQETETIVFRIAAVTPEPEKKRVRVDLESLPEPSTEEYVQRPLTLIPYLRPLVAQFATVSLTPLAFTRSNITTAVRTQAWRERDLQAMISIQGWAHTSLIRALRFSPPPPPSIALDAGAFGFREKASFFGHNAPKWDSLPNSTPPLPRPPYPNGWDTGDDNGSGHDVLPRSIWTNSQGQAFSGTGPHAFLERAIPGIVQRSWILIESPFHRPQAFPVFDARDESRADYGLSGKTTALTLADDAGRRRTSRPDTRFTFRNTTAHVGSRRLGLAELPIDSPIDQGATTIELDRMVLGLAIGQPIAFAGERADLPGVAAAEIAELAEIIHADARTTLVLRQGLQYAYVRQTLIISANVVEATHGEMVREPLGSGNASVPNQQFELKKPPLTYVAAATTSGARSTLEVRVNGLQWEEVPSLYGLTPERQAFIVRLDDDARARLIFGDGVQGARLPTGAANVTSTYRSGIGPLGEVEAGSLTLLRTLPLGVRGVTNQLPAGGAEGPEVLANARENAPLTVLTFERVVSLLDYEDFSRTFPGIGKALVDQLWIDGRDLVHVTVASATGKVPPAETMQNLTDAIEAGSDRAQRFITSPFALRYFTCDARLTLDPREIAADVLAAVETHLRASFAFETRGFGQAVTAAEVIALMHDVRGVVAVDLDALEMQGADGSTASTSGSSGSSATGTGPSTVLPAHRARWNAETRTIEPAELLLINPAGIHLEEMA
jgi:predicted phage baseplate assembly protein